MQTVLGSWKEIANYLGKGVRTVQRWERYSGLPVHRPSGSSKGVVLAFPEELEQWARRQDAQPIAGVRDRVNVQRTSALSRELVSQSRLLHESTRQLVEQCLHLIELSRGVRGPQLVEPAALPSNRVTPREVA